MFALLDPVSPDVWAGTTILLISTSPDSSDMPEPPTTSSPLHQVSRNGPREAREKAGRPDAKSEARGRASRKSEILNPKSETNPNDRNLNVRSCAGGAVVLNLQHLDLRACFGFRYSNFEFEILTVSYFADTPVGRGQALMKARALSIRISPVISLRLVRVM
jgi:hypothetical protein